MTAFSGFTFVFFCFVFRLNAFFVEAAALRSIVLRYAGAPIAKLVFFRFFSPFVIRRCRFFRVFFAPFPLSHCTERMPCVLSFRMVFFYLVTTGWISGISLLCENLTNQSINQAQRRFGQSAELPQTGGRFSVISVNGTAFNSRAEPYAFSEKYPYLTLSSPEWSSR